MVFDVYAKLPLPSQQHQRTAKPSHLHAHPQQFQPRSPCKCLGAERHICTPASCGVLLALISVPQPHWRYAERKVLFQGLSPCCRLAPTHAVQEHREFLPLESVQGWPEQSAAGPWGKASHCPYAPNNLRRAGNRVMTATVWIDCYFNPQMGLITRNFFPFSKRQLTVSWVFLEQAFLIMSPIHEIKNFSTPHSQPPHLPVRSLWWGRRVSNIHRSQSLGLSCIISKMH